MSCAWRAATADRSSWSIDRLAEVAAAVGVAIVVCALFLFGAAMTSPAEALPSFARQTGQPCGTCHTDFPGLTPYGRRFKLLGYTVGGGPYRTTPFSFFTRPKVDPLDAYVDSLSDKPKTPASAANAQPSGGQSDIWVPPISFMATGGYTHTQTSQVPPCGGPYPCNDTLSVAPLSFFYGGAITDHIGAFAQVTYNGAPFGAPYAANPGCADPFGSGTACDPFQTFQWSWDNTDVRYANTFNIRGTDVVFGITANNNPSVQDLWNTTPAWKFPFAVGFSGPRPATATLIDGGLGPGHVIGVGAYTLINDLLYLELTGYRSVSFSAQPKLGIDPYAVGMISGVAPYWRIALEPHWGNHWLMLGAYGMQTRLQQWDTTQMDANGFQIPAFLPFNDRFTDTAVDLQYQYRGSNYWFTLRGTYIHEDQKLDATFNAGGSSNASNRLDTLRLEGSLAYGNDNRVVFTTQYFNTKGSTDPLLYGGLVSQFDPSGTAQTDPNSNGFIFELAYIPFVSSKAPGWPWANMRVGLQYTYYNRFDGDSVFAHSNNTLFAYLWFAM
ncbi:MAG TPA: cytochrome C [Pseudolabrys sp.]|nr:cytochrome C [Pseudolabrys sp.]